MVRQKPGINTGSMAHNLRKKDGARTTPSRSVPPPRMEKHKESTMGESADESKLLLKLTNLGETEIIPMEMLKIEDIAKEIAKEGKRSKKTQEVSKKSRKELSAEKSDAVLLHCNPRNSPVFFEQYRSNYSTFESLTTNEPPTRTDGVNERLLSYVNDVFNNMDWLTTEGMATAVVEGMRQTARHTNVCISPLQAMRAWALLANLADNKTLDDLAEFIGHYAISAEEMKSLNDSLLSLHLAAEEDFDGCVRLFTELPHHLTHNVDTRRFANIYYGGKSRRAAIQHHSFATDSDGFYSCHRINQEVMLSTGGAVRFVVPETHAPNWRASIALASAMDCSFFWKTNRPPKVGNIHFRCDKYGHSSCSGYSALATIAQDPGKAIVRLSSHVAGVHLYLYQESEDAIDCSRSIDAVLLERIADTKGWTERECNVLVPQATCSTPISLFRQSKADGLERIYCSEKAELQGMHANEFQGHANFVTLFDHYHKTNFEILPTAPTCIGKVMDLGVDKSHQFVDATHVARFADYQSEHGNNPLLAYYEDHLDQSTSCMMKFNPKEEYLKSNCSDDVVLDAPFYFLMTRMIGKSPIIVCGGYFNNTIFVNQ